MNAYSFYKPGRSFLHRMHPSVKLVFYAAVFAITYVLPWQMQWISTGLMIVILWRSGISPWRYKGMLAIISASILTIPLFNGFWPADDTIIFTLGPLKMHEVGLIRGLTAAGLYGAIGMSTIMLLAVTQLWEMAEAPTLLGAPKLLGFSLAYIMRYIPEVAAHALELMNVWRTRGVSFSRGPIWIRFWLQCRLLSTLLILELFQIRAKANALEARGFNPKGGQNFILPPLQKSDRYLIWTAVTLTVVVVIWKILFWLWRI